MNDKNQPTSVLKKAWEIFSTIGTVIGTASMLDNIISWVGFIQIIINGYQESIRPVINLIFFNLDLPGWLSDYFFVGAMIISARTRAAFNNMTWKNKYFKHQDYPWYAIWAPHRVATILLSLMFLPFWPLLLVTFLPRKYQDIENNDFQILIHKQQYQWLGIYVLALISLFIINAAMSSIFTRP